MKPHRDRRVGAFAFPLLSCVLASCTRAPSFDILGSYFPAWLFCLTLGIVLTVVVRWLLLQRQIALAAPIVAYPSLAASFTFALWLAFFR